jgi:lysophospholipase L1-like esterase
MMRQDPSRWLRWLAPRLALSLVALAGALGGAELLIRQQRLFLDPRMLDPSPIRSGESSEGACYRPSITAGYEPVPGACGRNEQGMYGDHPLDKGDDVFRVLVLGDSIADQRYWVETLEAELGELLPGRRVETWNAGVPGYDTCSELRVLEERGLAIQPDLVLVQFCLNDYLVTSTIVPVGSDGARIYAGERVTELPRWMLRSHLATWTVVRWGLLARAEDPEAHAPEALSLQARHCFAEIQRRSQGVGAQVVGAIFPAFIEDQPLTERDRLEAERILGGHREGEARIQRDLDELGIPAVPLRPFFASQGPLESFRDQPHDIWHPDMDGQAIIGATLARELLPRVEPDRGAP